MPQTVTRAACVTRAPSIILRAVTLVKLIVVLFVANGTPILLRNVLGARFNAPVDGGRTLGDGRRLLGPNKTWRGLISAPVAAAIAAGLLGLGVGIGITLGSVAMLGDLATSFVKRRAGLDPSDQAFVLDQTPESLLPLLAVADKLALSIIDVAAATAAFVILGLLLSRVLFRVGVRRQPH